MTWKAFGPKTGLELCVCKPSGAGASLNRVFKTEIPVEGGALLPLFSIVGSPPRYCRRRRDNIEGAHITSPRRARAMHSDRGLVRSLASDSGAARQKFASQGVSSQHWFRIGII